jgi:hypothetical protein
MRADSREARLRYWAALNDHAYEAHGTDAGVAARSMANRVADELGDFTEADWGVIRNAQRAYAREASA